jgi:virginiamycin B lyase
VLRRGFLLGLLLALCMAPSAAAAVDFDLGPGTRALGIVSGPDGKVWFVGHDYLLGRDVVGSVSPSGEVDEFEIAARPTAGAAEITTGTDGNLWFTDPNSGAIGRLTTRGQITEFALPTAAAVPTAIVAGPGGLWFTEEAADKVGRISYAGAITEFPLPAGARPTGIAVGPDEALWVAEKGRGKIARLAPSGAVTEFALPDPESLPHAIVAAPGGDLWFSEEGGPRIGRITPVGAIDEFRVPVRSGTYDLAFAGDGNLWFTSGYRIGSIAVTGEVGEPACVDSSCRLPVNAIAKGPEGGLWFGSGLREVEAGSQAAVLAEPGTVGSFDPPPLAIRIGPRAGRVSGGLTTVGFSCSGGAANNACAGFLRLTALAPRSRSAILDLHRYRLQPASGRRLPLRLGRRGARLLSQHGKLVVRVTATLSEGVAANRRFVLRSRPRR